MRLLLCLPLLAACTSAPPSDTPFTGQVHRFTIDRFELPMNHDQVQRLGDDLDGHGSVNNEAGLVTSTLFGQADLAPNPSDLSNLIPTAIEINAHDLIDDDHVGVSYIGRAGEASTPATGTFVAGTFVSERTRDTAHPANGSMVLPLFVDADPTELPIQHGEIDLQPDGAGGYTAQLRGAIDPRVALEQAAISVYQMLRSNPKSHVDLAAVLTYDTSVNLPAALPITLADIEASSWFSSLLAPDITLEGTPLLSIGFGFHLIPCDSGTCAPATVIDHCDDRTRDVDETDVDCGGSCHPCGFETTCVVASDCQSGACDSGMCREPTCTDHIQDGFESGVDCGTYGCRACPGQ
ncbi:MAG: hypothetical protein ABI467_11230 [Kofleriaceae bacterium]